MIKIFNLKKKKERVIYIINELNKLYPNPIISLNYYNDFTLLIAVLLSAQTTDEKVNQVTSIFFKIADNPKKMQKLSLSQIKKYIHRLGLYNKKAQYIFNLTKIILEKYEGKIPNSLIELKKLPGVGHKTASILMSVLFNEYTFPVDTHIYRLMRLWKLSKGKNVKKIEEDAKKLFPINSWNKIHLQIINYGREYSPSKNWNLKKDFITRNIYFNDIS